LGIEHVGLFIKYQHILQQHVNMDEQCTAIILCSKQCPEQLGLWIEHCNGGKQHGHLGKQYTEQLLDVEYS
jgi:hypothetical protein